MKKMKSKLEECLTGGLTFRIIPSSKPSTHRFYSPSQVVMLISQKRPLLQWNEF